MASDPAPDPSPSQPYRPDLPSWRLVIARVVYTPWVQTTIITLIIVNAIVLGLETSDTITQAVGPLLHWVDTICLGIFVAEIVMKLIARDWRLFTDGWDCFDFAVVAIALIPATGPLAVLRGLRVLRVLRMLTAVPSMRQVIGGFLYAIPGLSSVVMVMAIFYYVAAVLATQLFGDAHPELFGTLGRTLFSLFQIMTLESWATGVARPVMDSHPMAWAFFVPFIVVGTFTILNLFIGIIVNSMQEVSERRAATATRPTTPALQPRTTPTLTATDRAAIAAAIGRVEDELAGLRQVLADADQAGADHDAGSSANAMASSPATK